MATPLALGSRRLIIVTGKGGVGKSTVAAALARALALAGRRALAVDVEGSGLSSVLGATTPLPEPTSIAPGLALAQLTARAALDDVVHGMMPIAAVARRLLESTTFQLLAAAAPGLPEYLVLAKIMAWLDATRLGRRRWDVVVVDAPASGHVVPLLTAPRALAALARIGPAATALARMDGVLRDPRHTGIWIVTRPEELAVRETIELHTALGGQDGLPVCAPIVNAIPPRRFRREQERLLASTTLDAAHPMIRAARFEIARRRAAFAHIATLRRAIGVRPVRLGHDPTAETLPTLTRLVAQATGLPA